MLFSIIVPVYKVEKYLPQCIESILNQSFSDFELILINDGSPDNSGNICDEYALRDSRIRVIHKENGGVSDARNVGTKIAKGDYIWYIDSDDYMVESALEKVAELIISSEYDVDVVTCAHINYFSNGVQQYSLLPEFNCKVLSRDKYLLVLYKSKGAFWAPWKNIYKRSIIIENNIIFPKGKICAEDCDFFIQFVLVANKFIYFNFPTIYYRIDRIDSVTNVVSKDLIMHQLEIFSNIFENYLNKSNKIEKKMRIVFANKFANTITLLNRLNNTVEIKEICEFISKHENILNSVKGIKYIFAKILWGFFGYYNGTRILVYIKSSKTRG